MRYLTKVDDLHFAEDGSAVAADHVVRITWQVDRGKTREAELDLTAAHLSEYGKPIEVLLEAARKNNTKPEEPDEVSAGDVLRPDGMVDMRAARRYGGQLRAYADQFRMRARGGRDRPVYETPRGGSYMPHWLSPSYEWWRKTGEVVIPENKSQEKAMTRTPPPWDFVKHREE